MKTQANFDDYEAKINKKLKKLKKLKKHTYNNLILGAWHGGGCGDKILIRNQ